MKEINPDKPVLVTGASGYIASWIVKKLVERGFLVHGTVRSLAKAEKIKHLLELQREYPNKLELFEADLMRKGSFKEAMKGCELVIHAASPFVLNVKDAQKELIEPALEGTRNVLKTVNETPSVKRVVQTSSCAAIYGDNADVLRVPKMTFTEEYWNVTSSPKHQAYSFSKTVAEKEGWRMAEAQERWDLVVINPGLVMGPSLSERTDSESVTLMKSMGDGKFRMGVPKFFFGMVDVRDVAEAHIRAGLTPSAKGRHILVAQDGSFLDVAGMLRKKFNGNYPFPKKYLPNFLLYAFGPLQGFNWKYLRRNVNIPIHFDNSYSKEDLNIEYRPLEETVTEHLQQLIDSGLLPKK
jgi:nucleoside-diphosphate-sugar epimerase